MHYRKWAERIAQEFNDQVVREKTMGLPYLGFMITTDEKSFCKNEFGFANFVVAPMWRALGELYPALSKLVQQLEENIASWKSLADSL